MKSILMLLGLVMVKAVDLDKKHRHMHKDDFYEHEVLERFLDNDSEEEYERWRAK